jgi:hypothetical protein
MVMDGKVNALWGEFLNSLLDQFNVYYCGDGEHVLNLK